MDAIHNCKQRYVLSKTKYFEQKKGAYGYLTRCFKRYFLMRAGKLAAVATEAVTTLKFGCFL